MMTALTAIFGLLPAALSTRIGAQTQRPLAIVVVGGMITTLFLTRYLMPVLYSFYGHREPPAGPAAWRTDRTARRSEKGPGEIRGPSRFGGESCSSNSPHPRSIHASVIASCNDRWIGSDYESECHCIMQ